MRPPIVLVAVLAVGAVTLAGCVQQDAPTSVRVPVHLESSQLPGTDGVVVAPSPFDVVVTPSSISFGDVRPGRVTEAVEIRAQNLGVAAVRVKIDAAPLVDPSTGASIPGSAVQAFLAPPSDHGAPLAPLAGVVPAGGSLSIWVRIDTPSGAEQYLPAGAYAGKIDLVLEAVAP